MRRFFEILGIFLIVFAWVVLISFIILPSMITSLDSVPPLKATFQALFCKTGETLKDSRTIYNPSPGTTVTTVNVSCVDKEGNERDISQDATQAGAVGYFVPFLTGLFMTLAAFNKKKSTSTYSPPAPAHYRPTPSNDSAPSAPAHFRPTLSSDKTDKEKHLESTVERLKELKSALAEGLITQAEYDTKHKEILQDM